MSESFLVAVEICPLCSSTRKKFNCLHCVKTGKFSYSNDENGELYVEKKSRISLLEERIKEPLSKIHIYHQRRYEAEHKRQESFVLSAKVRMLKEAVETLEKRRDGDRNSMKTRKMSYKSKAKEIAELKVKVFGFQNEANNKQKQLEEQRLKLENIQIALIQARQKKIRSLLDDIFPIFQRTVYTEFGTPPRTTIATRQLSSDLVLESSLTAESELEEATQFTYEEGQWVQTNLSETQYCIVEPGLPISGDYMIYYEWLKSYRRGIRNPDSDYDLHTHSSLGIPAALSYTVQAMNIISYFLDVGLPFRLKFGDFANPHICQRKLMNEVAKLNRNVMHLSFSQQIDSELLASMQTLKNLDICISPNNQYLGHVGAFNVYDYHLPDMLSDSESSIDDLRYETESDHDDYDDDSDNISTEDWDSLQDLPDVPRDVMSTASQSNSAEHSLSASATGLVTSAAASVASLWPWKRN